MKLTKFLRMLSLLYMIQIERNRESELSNQSLYTKQPVILPSTANNRGVQWMEVRNGQSREPQNLNALHLNSILIQYLIIKPKKQCYRPDSHTETNMQWRLTYSY